MIDYIRDGTEIYTKSFATIRAEADLSSLPPDLESVADVNQHTAVAQSVAILLR